MISLSALNSRYSLVLSYGSTLANLHSTAVNDECETILRKKSQTQ